jgi:hypothetical protein
MRVIRPVRDAKINGTEINNISPETLLVACVFYEQPADRDHNSDDMYQKEN